MDSPTKKSAKRSRDADSADEAIASADNLSAPSSSTSKRAIASAPEGSSVPKKKKKVKRKAPTPGIIYISRLPPGMTPQKVRHLMGRWGDIGKVYAQPRDAPTGYNANVSNPKKKKHVSANFGEAWVEFLDKSVAKTVASMLNAQVIGGKKGDKWRDDIWTMKYLSGFKWEMLGEQVAYERQAHQSRLRAEIGKAKTEQNEYLKNVELARVLEKRKAKKEAGGGGGGGGAGAGAGAGADAGGASAAGAGGGAAANGKSASREVRQRQAVGKSKTLDGKGMDGVLSSIFG